MTFGRMLVNKIENRILLGVVMFVGTMLMIGWVAINENGRMASFTQQYEARSIERGGELFAANCSTCHNPDGRGQQGRAPALNSPHLFGYDFVAVARGTLNDLQAQQTALQTERAALNDELGAEEGATATEEAVTATEEAATATEEAVTVTEEAATATEEAVTVTEEGATATEEGATVTEEAVTVTEEAVVPLTDERRAEINTRLAEIEALLAPEAEMSQNLAVAQQEYDAYITSIQTAIDNGYDDGQPSRLAQANWTGTLDAYIYTTLVHGRAQNAALWGGTIMAPWAQTAGGPLRPDQIQDLVNYITNWDKGANWTLEDLLAVNQFAQVPGGGAGRPEPSAPAVGDVTAEAVLAAWEAESITGDPARGELLYNNREWSQVPDRLSCSGCHQAGTNGPPTEGKWDRVVNERITLPEFAGYTAEQYLVESILHPGDYVVPGYNDGVMPQNYPERVSLQDLADLIEYIRTTSADYVPPEGSEATGIEEAVIGGSTDAETQAGANVDATPGGAQQAP